MKQLENTQKGQQDTFIFTYRIMGVSEKYGSDCIILFGKIWKKEVLVNNL